ncbi:hypothetical protein SNEBB_003438 [Seison nebaliae]|nr:hypothetical protein SNEBB_003438 [Seison nebaliae]
MAQQIETFKCYICSATDRCIEVIEGERVTSKFLEFKEKVFVLPNPFDDTKLIPLVIGYQCSTCNKSICPDCSLFEIKRFCKPCYTLK